MATTLREALLDSLNQQPMINVREALAASIGRTPAQNEIAAARRAARGLAEEGEAVLLTLYPGQVDGTERRKWGRHAVLHLTVEDRVILDLPYRVEVAVGHWEPVVAEGKRRTAEMVRNAPILARFLGPPVFTR